MFLIIIILQYPETPVSLFRPACRYYIDSQGSRFRSPGHRCSSPVFCTNFSSPLGAEKWVAQAPAGFCDETWRFAEGELFFLSLSPSPQESLYLGTRNLKKAHVTPTNPLSKSLQTPGPRPCTAPFCILKIPGPTALGSWQLRAEHGHPLAACGPALQSPRLSAAAARGFQGFHIGALIIGIGFGGIA